MPSNLLLLLPLLGGYTFIHLFYYTRFRAQALTGQRLIFETAIAGFIAVVPARILILLLRDWSSLSTVTPSWQEAVGGTPMVGTLCLSVLLAPVAAVGGNFALSFSSQALGKGWREKSRGLALRRAIEKRGTRLQKLLYHAAIAATTEKLTLVEIVLSDKRVYIGWVTQAPNLQHNEQFVPLLPFWTGHLDENSKLKLTQRHKKAEELRGEIERDAPRTYEFALPVSEIRSARLLPFGET